MKSLLILALKINISISFNYAKHTETLNLADAQWLVEKLSSACSIKQNPKCTRLNSIKMVHGYQSIAIEFIDGIPDKLKKIITTKKIVIKENKISLSNKSTLFTREQDIEFQIINRILQKSCNEDWPTEETNKPPMLITFPPPISPTVCNSPKALNSKPPKFSLEKYKFDDWVKFNNCLNWALNLDDDTPISIDDSGKFDCKSLIEILTQNHLLYLGHEFKNCKENREIIALSVGYKSGYHFLRKDEGEYWSHKAGKTMPSQLDYSYKLIVNPSQANIGSFNNFCGYFTKGENFINTQSTIKKIQRAFTESARK